MGPVGLFGNSGARLASTERPKTDLVVSRSRVELGLEMLTQIGACNAPRRCDLPRRVRLTTLSPFWVFTRPFFLGSRDLILSVPSFGDPEDSPVVSSFSIMQGGPRADRSVSPEGSVSWMMVGVAGYSKNREGLTSVGQGRYVPFGSKNMRVPVW